MNWRLWSKPELYTPVSEHILGVDRWKIGSVAIYRNFPKCEAYAVATPSGVSIQKVEYEQVLVPTFKIASSASVKDEEAGRGFARQARASVKNAVSARQDIEVFKALNAVSMPMTRIIVNGVLQIENISDAMARVETNGVSLGSIVMSAHGFHQLTQHNDEALELTPRWKHWLPWVCRALRAHYKGVPIYVSPKMPANLCFVLGRPDHIGVIVKKGRTKVVRIKEHRELRETVIASAEVGCALFYDSGIAHVLFNQALDQALDQPLMDQLSHGEPHAASSTQEQSFLNQVVHDMGLVG